MFIKEKISRSTIETNSLNLEVTNPEPSIILVNCGNFVVASVSYELDEDFRCSFIGNETYETDVTGYLALDSEGNSVVVVDEFILDGIDSRFNFNESDYTLLTKLFACRLPSGLVDLTNTEVRVYRIIPHS